MTTRLRGIATGIGAGLVASAAIVALGAFARTPPRPTTRLVAEDASAPLSRIAIHYNPGSDAVALPVYTQLLRALPSEVAVDVEVAAAADFARFTGKLAAAHVPHPERLHPVVVGAPITTWSRDRYAALVDADGRGAILAPPRTATPFANRAGDAASPSAISRALYGREPRVASIVFEGGDLAATPNLVFADVNLEDRNRARTDASRAAIELELHGRLAQRIVWIGAEPGDVPRHHIMMYLMPLDDRTVAVGDVRAGAELLGPEDDLTVDDLAPIAEEAARFDRAAAELAAQGFRVLRVPALVLRGAGSYVTYTNALFDRRGDQKIIYLPTYDLPALDAAGERFWRSNGYEVHPIDVSSIYKLNGSLGCLVNVTGRAAPRP